MSQLELLQAGNLPPVAPSRESKPSQAYYCYFYVYLFLQKKKDEAKTQHLQ
jgi:hypothetical protein